MIRGKDRGGERKRKRRESVKRIEERKGKNVWENK
jgi:hypothetical protein